MKGTLTSKILSRHLAKGDLFTDGEIAIRIDQTLTQDATGTMAMLQFMALDQERVKTQLSVSYVDHNTFQGGFENADDHLFLQSSAARHGLVFSLPGNGICHQLHLEQFAIPGKTLLGSDSHTPTAGAIGMLAIGAGGLDVAAAMAGRPFYLKVPKIVLVCLKGELAPWSGAKDVILYLLSLLSVKWGVGKIIEYGGEGVKTLSIPQRGTIANMGAELGVTSSIFPSDQRTRSFLETKPGQRPWRELKADNDPSYSEIIEVDLGKIASMVAKPHSPDNSVSVKEVEGIQVDQVVIGSCTNSSFDDLMKAAWILGDKKASSGVSLVIAPGSRRVLEMLVQNGVLVDFIKAGARILEPACGPCIGSGQAPPSGSVSVRTFNRNFKGRCGTADSEVYLTSPETAAATALTGKLTDPSTLDKPPPDSFPKVDVKGRRHFIFPPKNSKDIKIKWGPNIISLPDMPSLPDSFSLKILIKTGDDITTDDIIPAGPKILPLRSNIPAISEFVFSRMTKGFAAKAKKEGGGVILGGINYGQGSSREHAALAPAFLGVRGVFAVSFARIHRSNLINFGIAPFVKERKIYEKLAEGDVVSVTGLGESVLKSGEITLTTGQNSSFEAKLNLSKREREILFAGGLVNYIRANKK